jgi:hypothetical protein
VKLIVHDHQSQLPLLEPRDDLGDGIVEACQAELELTLFDQALNGLFDSLVWRFPLGNVNPEAFPTASVLETDLLDLGDAFVNALDGRRPPPTATITLFRHN